MLYKEITALADSLKLAVVPESFPRDRDQEAGCDSRVVEIVPFAHTDRYLLPDLLTWTIRWSEASTASNPR
jgi:hypothetical protein